MEENGHTHIDILKAPSLPSWEFFRSTWDAVCEGGFGWF